MFALQSQPWIEKKQLKKKRKLYKTTNENLETLATYKKVRSQIQRQIRKARWDHINAELLVMTKVENARAFGVMSGVSNATTQE